MSAVESCGEITIAVIGRKRNAEDRLVVIERIACSEHRDEIQYFGCK